MRERIAVFGAGGQLGRALRRLWGDHAIPLTRSEADITRRDDIERVLTQHQPDAVVNAAAYNLVDQAEAEPEQAFLGNAIGPRNLALACADRDLPFVHISSDYVFGNAVDSRGNQHEASPFSEDELPCPNSAYAVAKLAGEHFVLAQGSRASVLRTCGLYGPVPTPGRGNFVETMLRLASEREELTVVSDQVCSPTAVDDLALAIDRVLATSAYGLYHATNSGQWSWFEFATLIMERSGLKTPVRAVTTAEFGAPAARPSFSVLNCQRLSQATGFQFRSVEDAVTEFLTRRARGGSN